MASSVSAAPTAALSQATDAARSAEPGRMPGQKSQPTFPQASGQVAAPLPRPSPAQRTPSPLDAAADEATGRVTLTPPAFVGGSLRAPIDRGPEKFVSGWLFAPDASQRPWGITLQPPSLPRFVLLDPVHAHSEPLAQVCARSAIGFGFTLGQKFALSFLGVAVLLLPAEVVGRVPKGILAVVTALAIGFAPRLGAARLTQHARITALGPEPLAQLAVRRASTLQWLLELVDFDGLRTHPSLLLPAAPLQPSLAEPEVGAPAHPAADLCGQEAVCIERAAAHEWGMGIVGAFTPLPGSFLRHSWLRHHGQSGAFSEASVGDDAVHLRLSLMGAQTWRAELNEGLLWGAEHTGTGQQRLTTVDVTLPRASAQAKAARRAFLQALYSHEPVPRGLSAAHAQQTEEVRSHGEGWRFPWWLPFYKSFGVGHMRQTYVQTQQQEHGAEHQLALGVLGMDESFGAGRVQWELRLAEPRAASTCCLELRMYVPWLTAGRGQALYDRMHAATAPTPSALATTVARAAATTPRIAWRRDLLLQQKLVLPRSWLQQRAQACYAAGEGDGGPFVEQLRRVAAEGIASVRRRVGLTSLEAPPTADAMLLHLLATGGVSLLRLLHQDAGTNELLLAPWTASWGQTQALLQDAAWHLARYPRTTDKAPRHWHRTATRLQAKLAEEAEALRACPFTQAMEELARTRMAEDLKTLFRALSERALGAPPAEQRLPLVAAAHQAATPAATERTPLLEGS